MKTKRLLEKEKRTFTRMSLKNNMNQKFLFFKKHHYNFIEKYT